MNKIEALKNKIKNDWECFLITSDESRLYLSGFFANDAFMVVGKNRSAFFTDSRYIEAASERINDCEVMLYRSIKDIDCFLDENGYEKIFIENSRITVAQLENFKKQFKKKKIQPDGLLDEALNYMREIKDESEYEKIISAQRIAEKAFDEVLGFIKVGVSEREIAAFLEYSMRRNGADGFSFDTIALCGKNTSKPHGVACDCRVSEGDFVTMDFGAIKDGYHSDMTRTVAVGKVSEKQKEIYSIVAKAQNEALEGLKAGEKCSDCDKRARDVIKAAGYGEYFGHATGHGVGIEIHENPYLSPNSKTVLRVGNVVTVEPGIYIPHEFGVRIEDFVLITENGYENLTRADKSLITL